MSQRTTVQPVLHAIVQIVEAVMCGFVGCVQNILRNGLRKT